MERTFVGIVLVALLVTGVFRWIEDDPAPVGPLTVGPQDQDETLARLRALEFELAMAQARLADLEALVPESLAAPSETLSPAAEVPGEEDTPPEEDEPEPERASRNSRTLERIEQAGLTEEEFDVLETRAYELYLENFEQEWLRRRETYLRSEPLPSSRERLRGELGDEAYDRYLYANGSPNRVRVRRVLPGSAAQQAGLRDGDLILSYDGKRLFSFDDLRNASYDGSPGESVLVDVRRGDGTIMQLTLPRGPMGISGHGGWREAPGS